MAAAVTPRLAGPAPFQVTPPIAAATRIAFGALAGATETRLPVRTAAQPRNRGWIADHSEIGPTTWYQVEPSALRGPATIATRLFADRLPSRDAEVSGAARTTRPSTRTVPKPPTAMRGRRRRDVRGDVPGAPVATRVAGADAERVGVAVDAEPDGRRRPSSRSATLATPPPSTETWTSYAVIPTSSVPDQATVKPGFAAVGGRARMPTVGGVESVMNFAWIAFHSSGRVPS